MRYFHCNTFELQNKSVLFSNDPKQDGETWNVWIMPTVSDSMTFMCPAFFVRSSSDQNECNMKLVTHKQQKIDPSSTSVKLPFLENTVVIQQGTTLVYYKAEAAKRAPEALQDAQRRVKQKSS